ncbi:hypothetical protein ABE58_05175 [Bacillus safensis]|uniref:restriction endonuclease subunit S n=2 Tax=Bacillus safensis TaxID=561879 RepID=UPI0018CD7E8C|nr:restriction endonuclease subunit S [Bacillus safensis]MBG9816424.1 hypothetical protein [Bacillus safensis]
MSDKITKSPQIRFAGFTDAWEQRTFSELVNRVSKSSEVDELPRVEYEDIVSGQGELNKDIFAKESDKKGIEFEFGDTLFGKLRPYLQNWLLADFKGIAVGDWWVLRPNEMDSKFIYSLIQSSKYQIVANLSTGSKMPRSDWNVVSQTEFSVPTDKGEQAKIGQLFNQLNHLLTLHQRELGLLKDTKKSLLQKMFPKDGANIPEIRFAGFTDAWEQRKLESICGKIRNAFVGVATPYYVEGGHFYLESNNVKDGQINRNKQVFINDEFYKKQKNNWLHTGDIVMVQSGHVGHTAVIPEELDNTAAHALIIFSNYREKVDPYFLNYQFQTHNSKKKLGNITTGNTIKHILASEMKNFQVDIPKYEEQKKIGNFFRQLDDTITLHQRELNSIKDLKKSLLQQMFI